MTFHGRSPDDLPLAAYSTGVDPVEEVAPYESLPLAPEPEPEPAPVALSEVDPPGEPGSGPFAGFEDEPRTVHLGGPGSERPPFLEVLRDPRAHARDPRLLLGSVVGVGIMLFGLSLLGGGPAPATGANPSPSVPSGAVATAFPAGNASVEVSGDDLDGTFQLAGRSGSGPAVQARMTSTWGDDAGNTLGLGGPVSPGTRTTDATFVLTWTVLVEGVPVTFTSKAGECTVGMAVTPRSVTGSFICKKLKSDDGEHTVGATGTYRT